MRKKEYTEALTLGFLTRWYDLSINLFAFVKTYYSRIANYLNPKDSDRILDLGTGTANLAISIKRKHPRVRIVGVDPDEKILNIAKKKIRKENLDIKLERGLAQKLPFDDNYFDFVVSSFVIHHIPRPFKEKAFTEIKRVLKNGGTVLIVDFGQPKNIVSRFVSFIFSLFEDIGPAREGFIFKTLIKQGFKNVEEVESSWGMISFYKAKK